MLNDHALLSHLQRSVTVALHLFPKVSKAEIETFIWDWLSVDPRHTLHPFPLEACEGPGDQPPQLLGFLIEKLESNVTLISYPVMFERPPPELGPGSSVVCLCPIPVV